MYIVYREYVCIQSILIIHNSIFENSSAPWNLFGTSESKLRRFCSHLQTRTELWNIWVALYARSQLRLNKAMLSLLVSALRQWWPEGGGGSQPCSGLHGVWIQALAPVSGMALGKSLNASEQFFFFFFGKVEKIKSTRINCFLGIQD